MESNEVPKRQRSSDLPTTPVSAEVRRKRSRTEAATAAAPAVPSLPLTDVRECHPAPNGEKRLCRMRSAIDSSRLSRALSQRLFLVDTVTKADPYTREYIVLGSTGNVYHVTIGPMPQCTCPDAEKGNVSLIAQRALLKSEISAIFAHGDSKKVSRKIVACDQVRRLVSDPSQGSSSPKNVEVPRNMDADCPICFEELCGGSSGSVATCSTCHNGVHKECMSKWSAHKKEGKNTCPLCRGAFSSSPTTGGVDRAASHVNDEGYVNLAVLQPGVRLSRDTSTYKANRWNGFGDGDEDDYF